MLKVESSVDPYLGKISFAVEAVQKGCIVHTEPALSSGREVSYVEAARLQGAIEYASGVELDPPLLQAAVAFVDLDTYGVVQSLAHDCKFSFFHTHLLPAEGVVKAFLQQYGEEGDYFTKFCTALAVIQENSFGDSDTGGALVFPQAARLNHSCSWTANCEPYVSSTDKTISIVARRNIMKGEELTIDYLNLELDDKNTLERKELLLETRGFECKCVLCGEGGKEGMDIDETVTSALSSGRPRDAWNVLCASSLPPQHSLRVKVHRALAAYCELTGEYLWAAHHAQAEGKALHGNTLAGPKALLCCGVNIRRHLAKLPRLAQCAEYPSVHTKGDLQAGMGAGVGMGMDLDALAEISPQTLFEEGRTLARELIPSGGTVPILAMLDAAITALGAHPAMPDPPQEEEEEE